jgi:hypothetical protein
MILRGLFLLAQGKPSGMREFDSSADAFYASIAPLIAFPLVFDGVSVANGQWQAGILGFLGQLCAVLALPVIIQAFAQATGREALWLRTAVALGWSFWIILPAGLIAGFASAALVAAGMGQNTGAILVLGLVAGYLLWYRWFILRAGLGLGIWQAAILVGLTSAAIGLLTTGPALIDLAWYGRIVHY